MGSGLIERRAREWLNRKRKSAIRSGKIDETYLQDPDGTV